MPKPPKRHEMQGEERAKGKVFIGTSGWSYSHWRGLFYPEDLPQSGWFSYYRERFQTVEINNTFYHLPPPKTFQGWREQAPSGFVYAVKANRYITHIKRLRDPEESLEKFIDRVRLLGESLGPILYQLPPRWRPDLERLEAFIEALPQDLDHVFEFRDPRWLCPAVFDLLEREGVGFCIMSLPHIDCPRRVTSQVAYIRMHGSRLLYASHYTPQELKEWAEYTLPLLREGHRVYIYFNNDAYAYAVKNALELEGLIETPQEEVL